MQKDVKHSPLFSVVTVCFNSEMDIENTIKSVLNQTFEDYEYIIVDGKSTDKTLEIVSRYKPLFKGKMTVVSEKDSGIYEAMNKGIKISKGEYISLLNSGDSYENNTLEIVSNYASQLNNNEVIYGMQRYVDANGDEISINFYNINCIKEESLRHQSVFVSSYIYRKYGLYDTNYKCAADYDYFLKLSNDKNVIFTPVYDILSNFLIGGASSSYDALIEKLQVQYKYNILTFPSYITQLFKLKVKHIFRERSWK